MGSRRRTAAVAHRESPAAVLPEIKVKGVAVGGLALRALAMGALAAGSAAVGALAVGAVVVGRLKVGKAEAKKLTVGRLEVGELLIGGTPVNAQDIAPERASRPSKMGGHLRDSSSRLIRSNGCQSFGLRH
jgi:hypothetical protein